MKTKAPNFRIMRRREARKATANINIPKTIKVARIDHGFLKQIGCKNTLHTSSTIAARTQALVASKATLAAISANLQRIDPNHALP